MADLREGGLQDAGVGMAVAAGVAAEVSVGFGGDDAQTLLALVADYEAREGMGSAGAAAG